MLDFQINQPIRRVKSILKIATLVQFLKLTLCVGDFVKQFQQAIHDCLFHC